MVIPQLVLKLDMSTAQAASLEFPADWIPVMLSLWMSGEVRRDCQSHDRSQRWVAAITQMEPHQANAGASWPDQPSGPVPVLSKLGRPLPKGRSGSWG